MFFCFFLLFCFFFLPLGLGSGGGAAWRSEQEIRLMEHVLKTASEGDPASVCLDLSNSLQLIAVACCSNCSRPQNSGSYFKR